MKDVLLLKLAHIVGFGYWLGADLGVFYSSYFVANDSLSSDVRTAAARILFALDQVPRICMTLMLPLGLHLAWRLGAVPVDGNAIATIWTVCIAWLGTVVYLHFGTGGHKALLTRIDFGFRLFLTASLISVGVAGLAGAFTAMPYWIAAKLMIFGGLVGCGLVIRMRLRDFGPAFSNVAQGHPDAADNATIRRTLGGTRPFVLAIWIGLFASAALGTHVI